MSWSAAAVVPHDRRPHVQRFVRHSQRVLMVKMAATLDHRKPVAAMNHAGVAFAGDKIIGSGDYDQVIAQTALGEHRWSFPAAQPLTVPPVVIGDTVYLSLQSGKLLSLAHANGKLRWQTQLNSYVSRPLAIASATILAATASQHLYALDAASGKTLWLYDSESDANVIVRGAAPPLVIDKTIYYGTTAGNIIALDLRSGKRLQHWSPPLTAGRFRSIVGQLAVPAADTLVFASAAGLVGALDPRQASNQLKWQHQFSAVTTSVCRGSICYVGLARGEIVALDNRDGSVRWHKTLGWSPTFIVPYRDSHLYVSGSEGFVTKLRTTHGSRVWQENLGSSIFAPPLVQRGMIFFSTSMHNLYGLRL